MASHQVTITNIPRMIVGANDIVFEVRENNIKLGDLRVSQGNLLLKWSQFAQLAEECGKRRRYT